MCAGQWLEIHIGVSDLQKTPLDVHGTTKTMLNVWILQAHHDYSWLMVFTFDHKKSWNAAYWLNPSSLHVSMKPSRCHCAVDTAAPSKALRDEHFRDSEIPLAILPVRNMSKMQIESNLAHCFVITNLVELYDDFNAAHVVTYHLNYHKIGMEGICDFESSSMMFFSLPASGVQ